MDAVLQTIEQEVLMAEDYFFVDMDVEVIGMELTEFSLLDEGDW